jgi:putative CocE/NonD family hydrolase
MKFLFGSFLCLAVFAPGWAQPKTPLQARYTKFEYEIPMRDGKRLFTAVYVPKDVFLDPAKKYPILLNRTPYSVGPYGVDRFRESIGPSGHFSDDGYIIAYQDVRGRYLSEGEWQEVRPHQPNKTGKQTDEASDTYDTIDWMVKNVPGNSGKVGMWGISYPGFYVSAGMIDAHPALVAASPQAPVTDYYLGDDSFHNGAFMLAANFGFYTSFVERKGPPALPADRSRFDYGTTDGYEFFLGLGPLSNANERYFKYANPYWTINVDHTTYDAFWQARAIWRHLKAIKPAVMTVGGWFDAEDLQGPLRTHAMMEANQPPATNMLVMGPWTHGSWSRSDGDRVGNVPFGSKTGAYYREFIEFAFFQYHLKGKGDGKFPKAFLFETGRNIWRKFETWPPKNAEKRALTLASNGQLTWNGSEPEAFDEYISDPNKPVPYLSYEALGMRGDYMTEDQRFASKRTDVLTYSTPELREDVTVLGPIEAKLLVSTTGTDSDFVVKLIDVYPSTFPDAERPKEGPVPANAVKMGGYQQLVRGEPFRGKFRKSFEKPVAFEPGKPDRIEFALPDVAHTFRRGHRIMVQIQSSWFPLTDRNPQTFGDIPRLKPADFVKATQRVYRGGANGSRLILSIER